MMQKLPTVCVGSNYYHQTLEETINELGNRQISLITKNQDGTIISK